MNMINAKIAVMAISLLFAITSHSAFAGFDFCSGSSNNGGSGSFQQQILHKDIVEIGELPAGIEGVLIKLHSNRDVDIQLYDKHTGEKIVHWPNGILSGSSTQATSYYGVTVEWSGYNGDGTGWGNEYIHITGKTNRPFIMKVYGYQEGYATVNYSWTGGAASGCNISDSGGGVFQQQIIQNDIVKFGDIPPGINNLYIKLISDKDVDIQLYDKDNGTKIVAWPDGILNGSYIQGTTYQGMTIEWSGYNGDGFNLGHEYIKITGKTTRNLTMKAYGYQAGYTTVEYSWGSSGTSLTQEEKDYFFEIALGSEFGNSTQVIKKWTTNLRIKVIGSPTTRDITTLSSVIDELNDLIEPSGINISRVTSGENISIYFSPENKFSTIDENYVPINYGFFWTWWDSQYAINKARILISITDVTQTERSHLIREELTQVLGLMNDSEKYTNSIFYKDWTTVQSYTPLDVSVIETLYRKDIKPGMKSSAIEEVLK